MSLILLPSSSPAISSNVILVYLSLMMLKLFLQSSQFLTTKATFFSLFPKPGQLLVPEERLGRLHFFVLDNISSHQSKLFHDQGKLPPNLSVLDSIFIPTLGLQLLHCELILVLYLQLAVQPLQFSLSQARSPCFFPEQVHLGHAERLGHAA